MSDTCMTCRFWVHIDTNADYHDKLFAAWGFCCRYPPAVGHAQESGYGFNTDAPGGWPIPDGSDWCGEYGGKDA